MTDNRFPSPGNDTRFPAPGTDTRFSGYPIDARFPSPGVDTRFEGGGLAQAYLARMTGAEFGFSDLTRLFTANIGTTAVATAGDAIGLVVGLEKNSTKTLPQVLASQPELFPQPDFNSSAGLTVDAAWSIGGGVATANGTTGFISVSGMLTIGKLYRYSIKVTSRTSGSLYCPYDGAGGNIREAFSAGVYTGLFVAGSTTLRIYSSSFAGSIDEVSVKQVPASYATQATAGSRGSYQAGGILRVATDDVYPSSVLPGKLLMARAKLTGGSGTRVVAGSSGSATGRWNLYFNSSGQAACRVGDGAEQAAGADRTNVDGTIAIRRRDDNTIDLVIDGVVVNSAAVSGTPTTTQTISIGATNNNGTAASFFWGDIITGSKGDAIISGDLAPTDAELLALHSYLMAA